MENEIDSKVIKELVHTARFNREHIRFKTIIADIDGNKYALRISGVGKKTIKLDLYLSYDDILANKESNKLESELYEMINKVY